MSLLKLLKEQVCVLVILLSFTLTAQETINVMFYNLLEYPEALPGGRDEILKNILTEYQPDVFMVCELQSENGADNILDIALNSESNSYSRAPFIDNQSGGADLQQLVFYKTNRFSLETSEVITTQVRDINRYQLKLNTVDQEVNPVFLDLYVTHLKSSQGATNQNLRLDMVNEFTSHLETLDPNSFVIFAGDFNVYTSSEPAYQELLDPTNAIIIIDPINTPGSWHNNNTFQAIHTQSTRTSPPFGAGAGGGLDDRFDFITISQNMLNHPNLHYLTDSYKALGNNGNCYNLDISDEFCVGEFNQQLRNNLYSMSDHLPVIMQLETNQEFLLSTPETTANNAVILKNSLVKDLLRITVPNNYQDTLSFTIFNSLGQKVMQTNAYNSKNISLNVSFLKSGLYYIKTNTNKVAYLTFLKI